jgi:hypothetical protein
MSQEPGDLEQLRAELRAATKEWETAVAELAAYLRSGFQLAAGRVPASRTLNRMCGCIL